MQIKGKWALVTGASRGVGKEIASALAKQGCNLILQARQAKNCEAVINEIANPDIQIHSLSAELNDQRQVDRLIDDALAVSSTIDIVYNNAAVMTPYREDFWRFPVEDYEQSFAVNVIALARICQRIVPLMIKQGWGRVINVTSGIADEPELTPYAISKAAVDKYVRDLVKKLEGTGVAMNLLDPGWLRTDLGGPHAPNAVESVVPGALIPALIEKPFSGKLFCAQDYVGMSLEKAMEKYLKEAG